MVSARALKLGIVGGLGAVAGADLLYRIVRDTPVRSEGDHREILFEQRPMREPVPPAEPDYQPTHRKFYVFDALSRMEREGCDAALLPCFVTHTFYDELRAELGIRLISMTDAIADYVGSLPVPPRVIGVLTTPYVRKSGLFERLFGAETSVIYPKEADEAALLQAIYGPDGFKAGNRAGLNVEPINRCLSDIRARGASLAIPGLSELPLLFEQLTAPAGLELLDTGTLYARHALAQTVAPRNRPFKVGVVGGVGPAATVDFLDKLVSVTKAARDQDHVKVLVEQNPQIPDRTENILGRGPDPAIALYSTCKKLERGGADIIAIPCNTAHAYIDRLQRHLQVPIVSILIATTDHIRNHYPTVRRVGILATNGTVKSGLYQEALQSCGFEPILPDAQHQALVMESIYGPHGVKSGHADRVCREQLALAIANIRNRGAEVGILGCTELPLISPESGEAALPLVDPTYILARRCVVLSDRTVIDVIV